MNTIEDVINHSHEIESRLKYSFSDKKLLALAFVHRSFVNEHRETAQEHNERLEFLGDSILGLIISEYLFRELPDIPEGELSQLRSRIVEASSCVLFTQQLGVERFLLLSKGEKMNSGRGRESILADLFEAIIGAIFLDGGVKAAQQFVFNNFSTQIKEIIVKPLRNWKAELQDFAQKNFQQTPVYEVLNESGPDHSKTFEVSVLIDNKVFGSGKGPSKKEAQQSAASKALEQIKKQ